MWEDSLRHSGLPGMVQLGRCGNGRGRDFPKVSKRRHGRFGRKPRPPPSRPGLCSLLQFLGTGSLQKARRTFSLCLLWGLSHALTPCLPPGQLWCPFSPLGRMNCLTRLITLLAPGCVVSRTVCRRSWALPSHFSTAVVSSSTALASYPTAGPSPPWVSQDPGWEG